MGAMTMLEKVTGRCNLRSYFGRWYEIASVFKGHNFYSNTKTIYSLRRDGEVDVTELYERWSASERRFIKGQENLMHKSSVTCNHPLFWVVHRDDGYQYALLHDSRILCKQPYMDEGIYNDLLVKATEEGYDVAKIRKTSEYQREVVVQQGEPVLGEVTGERNLGKYVGQWYEIASFSSQFYHWEKRKTTYSLRDDGCVLYSYQILSPIGYKHRGGGGIYTPHELLFSVVHCDDDQCVLLDHIRPRILCKQPQMDEGIYYQLVKVLNKQGINTTKLQKTPAYEEGLVIELNSYK